MGRVLAESFLRVTPLLGYRSSMFNLVFATNEPSLRLWRALGFQEIGRIPKAARLRGHQQLVDAIIIYYDFEKEPPAAEAESASASALSATS